jgi:hypothetical protein
MLCLKTGHNSVRFAKNSKDLRRKEEVYPDIVRMAKWLKWAIGEMLRSAELTPTERERERE